MIIEKNTEIRKNLVEKYKKFLPPDECMMEDFTGEFRSQVSYSDGTTIDITHYLSGVWKARIFNSQSRCFNPLGPSAFRPGCVNFTNINGMHIDMFDFIKEYNPPNKYDILTTFC